MNVDAQNALNRMSVHLNRDIVRDSNEYNQLLLMAQPYIGNGAAHRCGNVMDILTELQTCGKLSIDNFDILLKMMDDAVLVEYKSRVNQAKTEIQSILNPTPRMDDHGMNEYVNPGKLKPDSKETTASAAQTGAAQTVPTIEPWMDITDAAGGSGDVYQGKRGYVLIINYNFKRPGANIDVDGLKSFFGDKLSYNVVCKEDISKDALKEELKSTQILLNANPRQYDFFILVAMSHGDENDILLEVEGRKEKIALDEIFAKFRNDSLNNFVGCPRLFIIQTCRGKETQEGYQADHPGALGMPSSIFLPRDADLLVVFSTTSGFEAYRHPVTGAVLIQELLTVLQQGYKTRDLEKMLTSVKRNVAQRFQLKTQMPCTWSTLTKDFYLRANAQ